MRGNARRLGEHRHIGIDQSERGGAQPRGHLAQENAAVRAAIVRIAVGEMPADVAVAQRPEDGIAERVDHDVAVRVRHNAAGMRDAHAAEHDMVALAEGVHVESLPNSHGTDFGHLQYSLCDAQILCAGDLDVEGRAGHENRDASPFFRWPAPRR